MIKYCINIYSYQKGSRTRFGIISRKGNSLLKPLKVKKSRENGSFSLFLLFFYQLIKSLYNGIK